ncbi:pilin [Candidatus Nomurabacteria bacterium]|nr:pilin [Candidatus Nomurabacteria bacterium]
MNILRRFNKFILITYSFLGSYLTVLAAENPVCRPGTICNPISTDTVNDFIKVFLEGALKIGIPIVSLAIIYCGFLFVEARGNPEKITKAKDALLYTLIGAAILLGSWALAQVIADTVLAI